MDLTQIDHPGSSTGFHHGITVDLKGWAVRLRPMGTQHRAARVFWASLPEDEPARSDTLIERLPAFLVDEVVLDWSGLTSNGEDVPYSQETALELFQLHTGLAQSVVTAALGAGDLSDDAARREAQDLGNLPAGSSPGASTSRPSKMPRAPVATSRPSLSDRGSPGARASRGNAGAT